MLTLLSGTPKRWASREDLRVTPNPGKACIIPASHFQPRALWECLSEPSAGAQRVFVLVPDESALEKPPTALLVLPSWINPANAKAVSRAVDLVQRVKRSMGEELIECEFSVGFRPAQVKRRRNGNRISSHHSPLDALFIYSNAPFSLSLPVLPVILEDVLYRAPAHLHTPIQDIMGAHEECLCSIRHRTRLDLTALHGLGAARTAQLSAEVHRRQAPVERLGPWDLLTEGHGLRICDCIRKANARCRDLLRELLVADAMRVALHVAIDGGPALALAEASIIHKCQRCSPFHITHTGNRSDVYFLEAQVPGTQIPPLLTGTVTHPASLRVALEIPMAHGLLGAAQPIARYVKLEWARGGLALRQEAKETETGVTFQHIEAFCNSMKARKSITPAQFLSYIQRTMFTTQAQAQWRLEVESAPDRLHRRALLFGLIASTLLCPAPEDEPDIGDGGRAALKATAYTEFIGALATTNHMSPAVADALSQSDNPAIREWSVRMTSVPALFRLAADPIVPLLFQDGPEPAGADPVTEILRELGCMDPEGRPRRPEGLRRPRDWSLADAGLWDREPCSATAKVDGREALLVILNGAAEILVLEPPRRIGPIRLGAWSPALVALAEVCGDARTVIPHQPLLIGAKAYPPDTHDPAALVCAVEALPPPDDPAAPRIVPKQWFPNLRLQRRGLAPMYLGLPMVHEVWQYTQGLGVPCDGMVIHTPTQLIKWKPNPTVDVLCGPQGPCSREGPLDPAIWDRSPGLERDGSVWECEAVQGPGDRLALRPLLKRHKGANHPATFATTADLVRAHAVPTWKQALQTGQPRLERALIRAAIQPRAGAWLPAEGAVWVMGSGQGGNNDIFLACARSRLVVVNVELSQDHLDRSRERARAASSSLVTFHHVWAEATEFVTHMMAKMTRAPSLYIFALQQIVRGPADLDLHLHGDHPIFLVMHDHARFVQRAPPTVHFAWCGRSPGQSQARWECDGTTLTAPALLGCGRPECDCGAALLAAEYTTVQWNSGSTMGSQIEERILPMGFANRYGLDTAAPFEGGTWAWSPFIQTVVIHQRSQKKGVIDTAAASGADPVYPVV